MASKRNRILPTGPQWWCRYLEVDSNGLYRLIPIDIGSPRLHPQTSVSSLIFQQRQSEGAKGYFFPVISNTFHIGNLFFPRVRSSSSLSCYYVLVRVLCKLKVRGFLFFQSEWLDSICDDWWCPEWCMCVAAVSCTCIPLECNTWAFRTPSLEPWLKDRPGGEKKNTFLILHHFNYPHLSSFLSLNYVECWDWKGQSMLECQWHTSD